MTTSQNGGLEEPPGNIQTVTSPSPKGLAISALVLGIAAFLLGLVPILGALLGVAAVVLGILALVKKQSKGLSITGLVLGAVGAISSFIAGIALLFSAALVSSEVSAETDQSTSIETPSEQSPAPEPTQQGPTREELVVEMEAMVLAEAQVHASEGLFSGTPTEAICSPVAGGSVNEITETTTAFECFIATGTSSTGNQTGVFYDVTKNWDTGYVTWQLRR